MITERTLKKWRAEALEEANGQPWKGTYGETLRWKVAVELSKRILRLTQELLDQHLLINAKRKGQIEAKKRFEDSTGGEWCQCEVPDPGRLTTLPDAEVKCVECQRYIKHD